MVPNTSKSAHKQTDRQTLAYLNIVLEFLEILFSVYFCLSVVLYFILLYCIYYIILYFCSMSVILKYALHDLMKYSFFLHMYNMF